MKEDHDKVLKEIESLREWIALIGDQWSKDQISYEHYCDEVDQSEKKIKKLEKYFMENYR